MPRPAYIAAIGIAVMTWGGGWMLTGVFTVWMAASMNPESEL